MTDPGTTSRENVLVLYTELAPYVLACLTALTEFYEVDVHLVHWPVNKEAPFDLEFAPGIIAYDRTRLDDEALLQLARRLSPCLVLASGWVDKGYLKACRALRKKGVNTVMSFDTAWRGDLKQWANAALARFWIRRTFSHAWVTGGPQVKYARRLGFTEDRIRTGFYSADTPKWLAIGRRLLDARSEHWPHRFLCVARYIPAKGLQLLCDAFAELCEEKAVLDWELWIVGTGELFDQITNSPTGKHPRIKHLGFKQAHEMESVLEQCGAFVLPSDYEPWGVVVHEMACAGLPLILSTAVGAEERFLEEGVNGHLFWAGDKETLKEALRDILLSNDSKLFLRGRVGMDTASDWSPEEWARTANELSEAK